MLDEGQVNHNVHGAIGIDKTGSSDSVAKSMAQSFCDTSSKVELSILCFDRRCLEENLCIEGFDFILDT